MDWVLVFGRCGQFGCVVLFNHHRDRCADQFSVCDHHLKRLIFQLGCLFGRLTQRDRACQLVDDESTIGRNQRQTIAFDGLHVCKVKTFTRCELEIEILWMRRVRILRIPIGVGGVAIVDTIDHQGQDVFIASGQNRAVVRLNDHRHGSADQCGVSDHHIQRLLFILRGVNQAGDQTGVFVDAETAIT